MDKTYTLPDLPSASYSELQGLVRRLIEYADLSACMAIDDWLQEHHRISQWERFRQVFSENARRISSEMDDRIRWKWTAQSLLEIFWIDLFGWEGVLSILPPVIRSEEEVYSVEGAVSDGMPAVNDPAPFRVSQNLQAGDWVVRDFDTITLRLATPDEIPQEETANG